jgi:hypothetical protein
MVLPSYSPLIGFVSCGSGRDEEPSGEEVLRLIQIRLTRRILRKISPACQDHLPQSAGNNFEVDKRGQFFSSAHTTSASQILAGILSRRVNDAIET